MPLYPEIVFRLTISSQQQLCTLYQNTVVRKCNKKWKSSIWLYSHEEVSFLNMALPQTQHLQVMLVTVATHCILVWLEQDFQETPWNTTEPYLLSPGILYQLIHSSYLMFK